MARGAMVWMPDTLTPRLVKMPKNFNKKLNVFMELQSEKVQDFMRLNAPWTDRTGNARQGLFAKNVSDDSKFSIVCYHTVPYGVWLEVANDSNYAVILPTIKREGARIMGDLDKFFQRLSEGEVAGGA